MHRAGLHTCLGVASPPSPTQFEQATDEIERKNRERTIGARLGQLIIKKGLRVADLVERWATPGGRPRSRVPCAPCDAALVVRAAILTVCVPLATTMRPDGDIREDQFVEHCLALGVEDPANHAPGQAEEELHRLFRELDDDGGGSLDKHEVRQALRMVEDQAYAARQEKLDIYTRADHLAQAMDAAQADVRKQKQDVENAHHAASTKVEASQSSLDQGQETTGAPHVAAPAASTAAPRSAREVSL